MTGRIGLFSFGYGHSGHGGHSDPVEAAVTTDLPKCQSPHHVCIPPRWLPQGVLCHIGQIGKRIVTPTETKYPVRRLDI